METALYFAVVAHGDIMQGAEEEGLVASNGFLVATATLERVEQKVDALNLIPLYVKQHLKTQRSDAVVDSLPIWGQVYSSYQPDLWKEVCTKARYSACTNCDGLYCSVTKCCGSADRVCESYWRNPTASFDVKLKLASCQHATDLVCFRFGWGCRQNNKWSQTCSGI